MRSLKLLLLFPICFYSNLWAKIDTRVTDSVFPNENVVRAMSLTSHQFDPNSQIQTLLPSESSDGYLVEVQRYLFFLAMTYLWLPRKFTQKTQFWSWNRH